MKRKPGISENIQLQTDKILENQYISGSCKSETGELSMQIRTKNCESGILIKYFVAFILLFTLFQDYALADTGYPLPVPEFSHTSGLYEYPFVLYLSTNVIAGNIYFTLDGSEPDPDNLNGSTYKYKNTWVERPGDPDGELLTGSFSTYVYSSPITITNRLFEPDSLTKKASSFDNPAFYIPESSVFKGTVVRAITAKAGYTPSPVVTHTFFVHPQIKQRYNLPIIAITTNEANLFDYHKGIYTPGVFFDNWRKNNPGIDADGGNPGNYHQRGVEWEYPANFSFWDSGSSFPDLIQDVGIRIHGGWSRAFPMKSLRIYARSDYGDSRLRFPFFPEQDYNGYKRLMLRNSGNDNPNTMFRDALIQRVCREMNFETLAYRPVVLFLNGEYWGIHNIRERYDKHYIERVFGIEEEDLDLLTGNGWSKEGDNHHYRETINYIEENGLIEDIHYEYIKTRIDTENFIDYQIANIFSANTDWPGNNIDFFRKRTVSYQPYTPYGHDGRWRWMAFDMDFGFGIWGKSPAENVMEFATEPNEPGWPNPPWSTFLLRSFLENDSFTADFVNRFAGLLNTSFRPERVIALLEEYQQALEPDFPEHITRWKRPTSIDRSWEWNSWYNQINMMRNFADQRPSYQWGHLMDYFDLDTVAVTVGVSSPEQGYIRINDIDILPSTPGLNQNPYPWRGTYFSGVPVTFEAVPKEGYRFSHWEGTYSSENPAIDADPSESISVTAHFSAAEEKELIHYWHFNDLSDADSVLSVSTDFSAGDKGEITYPGSGPGYMDMVEDGTAVNLEVDQEPGYGLRVRNPSDTREMIIHAPSTGFENLGFSFAVRRTPNGAYNQTLYASTDFGDSWIQLDETYIIQEEWNLVSFDLSGMTGLNDNPGLQFRILFGGENAGGTSGNNRFDNISLRGRFLHEYKSFYSKAEGHLNELSTWGSQTDGSGESPDSFSAPGTVYYIQNRSAAFISGNWAVSGVSSKVVLGNNSDQVEFTIPPAFSFAGRMDIADNATLVLQNTVIPDLYYISPLSTIVFEQNDMVITPPRAYGSLHLKNSLKVFYGVYSIQGNFMAEDVELSFIDLTTLSLEGDLSYLGIVETGNPQNVNILAEGNNDQTFFSEDNNQLDAYNIYIEKSGGSFITATDIYARNNLRLDFTGDAVFSDGGHTLQLNDDLRLRGSESNFDMTGTIILTAETGTNDMEIINISLNNLVIDVSGDARVDFNDATDPVNINNDLTIKSSSSRPVRLRDKRFLINGNLLTDVPGPDHIEQGQSYIILLSENEQMIENPGYDGPGLLQNITVNNESGITLVNGSITFDGMISFETGIVHTSHEKILKLGPEGTISQISPESYVNGPFGIYINTGEMVTITFPVGNENGLRKVILEMEHEGDDLILYTAEHIDGHLPQLIDFEAQFNALDSEGYYNIESDHGNTLSRAAITFSYREGETPAEELTIASLQYGEWVDLGAEFLTGQPDMIRSTVDFAGMGIFTVAGRKESPSLVQDIDKNLPVYPNPVTENGTIYLPEHMDITMINLLGITLRTAKNVDRLNLRGIPPGIYFLKNQHGWNTRIVILSN